MAYQFRGQDDAPYFINLQPFKLDFSPLERSAELQGKLLAAARVKEAEIAQRVNELEMPKFEGISTDVANSYQTAIAARTGMEQLLANSPNKIWTYNHDPEFKRQYRAYQEATSPYVKELLKAEQKNLDGFKTRVAEKPGASAEWILDNQGELVQTANGIPLTAGYAAEMRELDPSAAIQKGGLTSFAGAIVATPEEENQRIDKAIQGIGKTAWERTMSAKAAVAAGLDRSGVSRTGSGGSSNENQIEATVRALVGRSFAPNEMLSIIQAYSKTPEFAKKLKEKPETFYDENGKLRADLVFDAALNDKSYRALRQKGVEEQGLSFYDAMVWNRLRRFSETSSKESWDLYDPNADPASRGNKDKIQYWQALVSGVPHNLKFAGNTTVPVNVPSPSGGGAVVGMEAPVYTYGPMPGMITQAMKDRGVVDKDGKVVPGVTLKQAFGDKKVLIAINGQELPPELYDYVTVEGVNRNSLQYYPNFYGQGLEKEGSNGAGIIRFDEPAVNYPGADPVISYASSGEPVVPSLESQSANSSNYSPYFELTLKLSEDRPSQFKNFGIFVPEKKVNNINYPGGGKAPLRRALMKQESINTYRTDGIEGGGFWDGFSENITFRALVGVAGAEEQASNAYVDPITFDTWKDSTQKLGNIYDNRGSIGDVNNSINRQVGR